MTRQRIVFGAGAVLSAAVVVAISGVLAGCGGSSSETPPPLEPDPRGFHYAPALPSTASESDAGAAPSSNTIGDDDDKPHTKASPTWGAAKTPAAQ
jgi:hypothetical protein